MSSKWYWRDGTLAVDMDDPNWQEGMAKMEKKLRDMKYKRVAYDELKNGYRVSTVWLGLDHNHGWPSEGDKPLIFETMVFLHEGYAEQDMQRYSTEKEAVAGHKAMVKKWKKRKAVKHGS